MKYIDWRNLPCYKCYTENDMVGSDKNRLEFMELEKEEMLFADEMKKCLWIKEFKSDESTQNLKNESQDRMEILERLSKIWEEI